MLHSHVDRNPKNVDRNFAILDFLPFFLLLQSENHKEKNTSLAAKGALTHRLQNPKWPAGSGKVSTPRFLGNLSNFREISCLI